MHLILEGYFRYEIVSKIHVGPPHEYGLPIISLFKLNYSSPERSAKTLRLSPYHFNQLWPHFYNIQNIEVQNPITRNLDSINPSTKLFSTTIWNHFKISSISLDKMNPSYYKYTGMSDLKNPFIRVNVDPTFAIGNRGNIALVLRYNFHNRWTVLAIDRTALVAVKIHKTKLLPDPYSSRCFKGHIDNHRECAKRLHYQKYSKHPYGFEISSNSNINRMDPDQRILNECARDYDHILPCESTFFETTYGIKIIPSDTIDIEEPRGEESCEFIPKTNLFDVFILIADTFGLWLGISIGLIFTKISEMLKSKNVHEAVIDHTPVYDFNTNVPQNNDQHDIKRTKNRLLRRHRTVHSIFRKTVQQ